MRSTPPYAQLPPSSVSVVVHGLTTSGLARSSLSVCSVAMEALAPEEGEAREAAHEDSTLDSNSSSASPELEQQDCFIEENTEAIQMVFLVTFSALLAPEEPAAGGDEHPLLDVGTLTREGVRDAVLDAMTKASMSNAGAAARGHAKLVS